VTLVKRDDPRFGKLWPAGQEYINVATLWDYFARYDYLPMLAGPQVLQSTIAWGVERGLFAYCLGDVEGYTFDTIRINEYLRVEQCPINDHAWLLQPDIARQLLAPDEEIASEPVSDEGLGGVGPGPTPPVSPALHRVTHISIETALNPLKWRDFYNSVIQPLINKGARINIDLVLTADRDEGFDQDFVELTIKESVSQLDREARVETE
jgi:hypothetical protein